MLEAIRRIRHRRALRKLDRLNWQRDILEWYMPPQRMATEHRIATLRAKIDRFREQNAR
jgi:hypothetical protein